jgi:hypothetical protein
VASADYASVVIFKTRDVCFAGSLVKHQLSMGKRMRFQSHLGQTKVVFDNQSKNAQQCATF